MEDHAFQDKIKLLEFVWLHIYIYMLVAIAVEQHFIDGRFRLPKIFQCKNTQEMWKSEVKKDDLKKLDQESRSLHQHGTDL